MLSLLKLIKLFPSCSLVSRISAVLAGLFLKEITLHVLYRCSVSDYLLTVQWLLQLRLVFSFAPSTLQIIS